MRTGRDPRRHRTNNHTDDAGAPAADVYTVRYRAYHAETFDIDPAPFLGPFARRLPTGSRVLDVGCGSGRDLVWLRQQGFEALSLAVVHFHRALSAVADHSAWPGDVLRLERGSENDQAYSPDEKP